MKRKDKRRVEETSEVGHGNPLNTKVFEDKSQARVVWPTTPSADFIYKSTSNRIRVLASAIRGD